MQHRDENVDLDTLIQTRINDPIAISLAETLLAEAGIPFFTMDQNVVARQESGNFLGWWTVRVPKGREAEALEILDSIVNAK